MRRPTPSQRNRLPRLSRNKRQLAGPAERQRGIVDRPAHPEHDGGYFCNVFNVGARLRETSAPGRGRGLAYTVMPGMVVPLISRVVEAQHAGDPADDHVCGARCKGSAVDAFVHRGKQRDDRDAVHHHCRHQQVPKRQGDPNQQLVAAMQALCAPNCNAPRKSERSEIRCNSAPSRRGRPDGIGSSGGAIVIVCGAA